MLIKPPIKGKRYLSHSANRWLGVVEYYGDVGRSGLRTKIEI
jgi:hypothetical protein